MPRWQEEGDEESIFWKFVHVLLPQIDTRGRDELFHEPEQDDGRERCHPIRLGNKRTIDGTHRGEIRAVQMRCTYCSKRNKINNVRGRSPLTAWCFLYIVMCTPVAEETVGRSTSKRLD
jgi:hypothetical protein